MHAVRPLGVRMLQLVDGDAIVRRDHGKPEQEAAGSRGVTSTMATRKRVGPDKTDARHGTNRRILAFDGLRGVAALIVVIYHYICLLHWNLGPRFSDDPLPIADTPLAVLWNGPFAVTVFFVLSGFVMAASAERRRHRLVVNGAVRYLRLAVPVTASVILAWLWLTAFPTAVQDLQQAVRDPSPWLAFTYQGEDIPGFGAALLNGLVTNFMYGGSNFNNVLWAMRFELLGSLMLFVIYWMASGQARLWMLAAAVVAILVFAHPGYLGFVAGALMFEAYKAGFFNRAPTWSGAAAVVLGLTIGAAGPGFDTRMGLPEWPPLLRLGNTVGFWPVLAACALLYAALVFMPFRSVLEGRFPQFLGRISFGLYLTHVPPLYTLVAVAYLDGTIPEPVLVAFYGAFALLLGYVFTILVDEPNLRLVRRANQFDFGKWGSLAWIKTMSGRCGRADKQRPDLGTTHKR
jgi:peptidoglycan/LPS O-acetylase OafA/YrhL